MAIASAARYAPTATAKSKEEKQARTEKKEEEGTGGGGEKRERVMGGREVDRGGQVFVARHGMLWSWRSASGIGLLCCGKGCTKKELT